MLAEREKAKKKGTISPAGMRKEGVVGGEKKDGYLVIATGKKKE